MRKIGESKKSKSNIIYVTPGAKRSNNPPPRSKRKLNARKVFLIVFSLWALYTFMFVVVPNKTRLNHEKQQLEQQYAELKQQEQKLNTDLNNFQNESYIAWLARKYYNMIKQGEILFRPNE